MSMLMSISHLLTFTFARPRGSTQLFFFYFFCTFFFFPSYNLFTFARPRSMQLFSFLQIFNIAHFQGRQVYQIFVSTNFIEYCIVFHPYLIPLLWVSCKRVDGSCSKQLCRPEQKSILIRNHTLKSSEWKFQAKKTKLFLPALLPKPR